MKKEQISEGEVERLVAVYSDLILRLSFTYLKSTSDAEDICQVVFLKLLTGNQVFENATHEKAWIIRATANACKDVLRSGHRSRSVGLDEAPEVMAPRPAQSDVLDEVMLLPEMYREAIYLYYFEGYSIKEIAAITERSEAAVSAHLSRGRNKLRAPLEEGGFHGKRVQASYE